MDGDRLLAEKFVQWMQKTMGWKSLKVPSPTDIQLICQGSSKQLWNFLIENALPERHALLIKANLGVLGENNSTSADKYREVYGMFNEMLEENQRARNQLKRQKHSTEENLMAERHIKLSHQDIEKQLTLLKLHQSEILWQNNIVRKFITQLSTITPRLPNAELSLSHIRLDDGFCECINAALSELAEKIKAEDHGVSESNQHTETVSQLVTDRYPAIKFIRYLTRECSISSKKIVNQSIMERVENKENINSSPSSPEERRTQVMNRLAEVKRVQKAEHQQSFLHNQQIAHKLRQRQDQLKSLQKERATSLKGDLSYLQRRYLELQRITRGKDAEIKMKRKQVEQLDRNSMCGDSGVDELKNKWGQITNHRRERKRREETIYFLLNQLSQYQEKIISYREINRNVVHKLIDTEQARSLHGFHIGKLYEPELNILHIISQCGCDTLLTSNTESGDRRRLLLSGLYDDSAAPVYLGVERLLDKAIDKKKESILSIIPKVDEYNEQSPVRIKRLINDVKDIIPTANQILQSNTRELCSVVSSTRTHTMEQSLTDIEQIKTTIEHWSERPGLKHISE